MSSTTAATARRAPVRVGARSRPRLIVVASPRTAGKAPFVILVGGLLLAGLLSLLMLHTLAAQDSFRQTSLQQRLANLTDVEQRLQQQVQLDSAPSQLRHKAHALGMVPSTITHYKQLPDGRTVAHEVAATAGPAAIVTTTAGDAKNSATQSDATQNDAADSASNHDATVTNSATNDTPTKQSVPSGAAKSGDTESSGSTTHGHHGAADR